MAVSLMLQTEVKNRIPIAPIQGHNAGPPAEDSLAVLGQRYKVGRADSQGR